LKYSIGLDIGISSVGWAVVNMGHERTEKMGVRVFDAAENPKNGSSLATPRREARSARRRLRRRRYRVARIRNFILNKGLLTQIEMDQLFDWKSEDLDIWLIRVNGIERKLSDREFARVLIHFAKNRGFKSNRKSEEAETETGVVLSAVKENTALMKEKGYRTVSEMLLFEAEKFKGRKRNKGGEYTHVISRAELEKEIRLIFAHQRKFGQEFATIENEENYLKIWNSQRPFAAKDDILKKIGNCTFEKNEKRAPKFSYTFERFRALDKLNKLRILSISAPQRMLTIEEREAVLQSLFHKKEVKYKDLRKLLHLKETEKFNELFYDPSLPLVKNENVTFLSLEGQWKIRKAIEAVEGKVLANTYRPIDIDTFAYALTVFKDDQDIREYLTNSYVNEHGKKVRNLADRSYDSNLIDSLLSLSFSKFGHLSLKALHNILPYLEDGYLYHEACEKSGYEFSKKTNLQKQRLLPVIPTNEIVNPVVIRSLSQTRKVINGIIKRYGSPSAIYIELAREMGRPYNERRDIEKLYNKNRTINENAKNQIRELHPAISDPRGHDILKYKLWQEQNGRCAYSHNPISVERLFDPGYVEVDHIIPYSRSFDDSNANKVLVLKTENQNKQNRTPFEWFGHDESKWQAFTSSVMTLKVSKKKKDLLLKMNFDDEQAENFKSRHLNDTRYITRFLKNFIEDHLQFREEEGKKQYVYSVNGAYTSLMRKRWGFNKNRTENDLHHALDAVIVAVSHPFRHRVSTYFKRRETTVANLLNWKGERFPEPWEGFVKEVQARMVQDSSLLKRALESLEKSSYDTDFIEEVEPIFVSRMPKRSVKGQIHEETLRRHRGYNEKGYIRVVTKTKLENITFDKNGDFSMYNKESDLKTYNTIKQRYLESGKNKKKAFSTPLYKPAKDPAKASIIRSVKIEDITNRVVPLDDKTVAANASIARTEVFRHKVTGKFYLAPVYVSDVMIGKVPEKFITQNKSYENWLDINDEYEFLFNLFPNDLIKIKMPKEKETKNYLGENISWQEGVFYFKGVHSRTAQINIIDHMNSFEEAVGSQRLLLFEKYQVDPLGNITKIHGEKRHGIPAHSYS
jgi:CRISPR-associated endonuclease Csn1